MTYECRSQIERTETEVLAVYCSDYRFQAGIREFLDQGLGLGANYDGMVVPGGPQCLVEVGALPKFSWVARKWSRMLVQAHSLKRLVLIAHQDCGWYKWLEQWQPTGGAVRRKQEEDLRAASRAASQLVPGLTADLFYAGWNDAGAVTVEAVCQ
ncbi:MAG TPA: hypothetical protein VMT20_18805 [Terriglobia bacterium]|nr:hypothetical protein [Terriglobia bacterium]